MLKTVRYAIAVAAVSLLGSTSMRAQVPQDTAHKPGGVNKVARDVSKTFKKAGRDTKAELKRTGSKTHKVAQKAGNDTKKELSRATGIKGSQSKDPGGLNKVARDVSKTVKKAGRDTRDEKNRVKAKAHAAATDAGKTVKDSVIKP